MSYYKQRRSAIIDIDALAKKSASIPEIVNKISLKYGFGKKIVIDRLQNLEELGIVSIEGKQVVS